MMPPEDSTSGSPLSAYDEIIRACPETTDGDAPNVKLEHRLVHLQATEARELALRSGLLGSVVRDFEGTLLTHAAPNGRLADSSVVWRHARTFVAIFHLMVLDATTRIDGPSDPRDEECDMLKVWRAVAP